MFKSARASSVVPASFSQVEPLESRIAPAVLVNGANLLGGAGNDSIGETSLGDHSVTLVKVTAGQVLVWYQDGAITSVSFGDGAAFELLGNVGDIIGNLGANGRLSDSDNNPLNGEDGNVLLGNNLAGLKISPIGSQKGSAGYIITGGSVSNVSTAHELLGIYAGDGAFHAESDAQNLGTVNVSVGFDTNPLLLGLQPGFSFTEANAQMKAGASVKNITVGLGKELEIIAGNGSPLGGSVPSVAGAAGGSIENITLQNASVDLTSDPSTPSVLLIAGNGGGGKTGGAGGSVVKITDENSAGNVQLFGGHGGAGLAGKGGDGGSIRLLDMRSDSSRYEMVAGNGGSGAPGGAGGSIVTGNFSNLSPTGGLVKAGDFDGDGADDLLVVDTSSGGMVIMLNDGSGSQFNPAVQYTNSVTNEDIIVIPSFGTGPSDVAAGDVDGDGDTDFVVAYKNSRNLQVLLNNGDATFYNVAESRWVGVSLQLNASPSFVGLAESGGTSTIFAVENQTGKSTVHRVFSEQTPDGIVFDVSDQTETYNSEATNIAVSDAGATKAFISFKNGHVGQIVGTGTLFDIGLAVSGGVSGLDVSEDGTQLLALGTGGRSVALYDISSNFPSALTGLTLGSGRGLVAHFVHDTDPATPDQIAVLVSTGGASRIDTFTFEEAAVEGQPGTWSSQSLASESPLKNFDVAYTSGAAGFGVLGAAINEISFAPAGGEFAEYSLPFSGKRVFLTAGDGGFGMTIGNLAGKGGAGGGVSSMNVVATEISIIAGDGGDSANAGGGLGGSITNGPSFSMNGNTVLARLIADSVLSMTAGDGGNVLGAGGSKGIGGSGGGIAGIRGELGHGTIFLATGDGGTGNGGAGGAGGGVNRVEMMNKSGSLSLFTGSGGNAVGTIGAGGAGGSVNGFSYELRLDEDGEAIEEAYSAQLVAGNGGNATGGSGGAGGSFSNISIIADPADMTYDDPGLNPPKVNAHLDSTFRLFVDAGNAGNGASGGVGGSVRDLKVVVVHDQRDEQNDVFVSYATAAITTGLGGNGTAGNGGAGGDFVNGSFKGVSDTDYDATGDFPPALLVIAQNGGSGTVKGGAGGNLLNIVASNSPLGSVPGGGEEVLATNMLSGAYLIGGHGGAGGSGDGGRGGDLSGLKVSAQDFGLYAIAGDGANSTSAKGGAGGAVKDSTLALVATYLDEGMVVVGGQGGNGSTAGGAGGALSKLKFNGPIGRIDIGGQTTLGRPISLAAGDGGDATGSGGKAGAGGDINGITQTKDVFSSISSIVAGNGGNAGSGVGGKGGSVLNVKTVGFIGKPTTDSGRLGLFDEDGEVQGIFVGRGGSGAVSGINGSVTGVVARQIAAIAARADASGNFAAATKVSAVTSDLIGYDLDGDGQFDGATTNPGTGVPIDGFLFAKSITGVKGSRPAFTFIA